MELLRARGSQTSRHETDAEPAGRAFSGSPISSPWAAATGGVKRACDRVVDETERGMKPRKKTIGLRWVALYVMVAVVVTAGGLVFRAGAASGPPAQAAGIPAPAAVPAPGPAHKPEIVEADPITLLLRSATVLAPQSYKNLTIFPVRASRIANFGKVLAMDEALNRGLLVIQELGSGSVNQVVAVNRSDGYVFLMASEVVGGAKQDRTVGEDVLLAPRSKVTIPVFCVEAHRWTAAAPDAKFRSMNFNAPMAVRMSMRLKQDQSEVWSDVEREQMRLGAPSETGALRSVYESPTVQRDLSPYLSKLRDIPSVAPDVIGVVVARGGRIVCADVFYRPDLFRHLWPRLLQSYAADAIGHDFADSRLSVRDAEQFLGRLYHAKRTPEHTPGEGRVVRLHAHGITGSALVYRQSVVHLEAFPGIELLPQPEPIRPMNLDLRRQRLEGER
jgi:hypothetical protein